MVDVWGDVDGKEFNFSDIQESDFPGCLKDLNLLPKEKGCVIIARKPYIDALHFKRRSGTMYSQTTDILFQLDIERPGEKLWDKLFAFGDKSENRGDEYCHDAVDWYAKNIFLRDEGKELRKLDELSSTKDPQENSQLF